ncbi:amino acid ABC transporter ATP-binding protein [Brenneria populi subsp. brevivirga]|uniref:amino acid ABC transporter ATP-binding protein n=1 Tax=Brenneria populi TaxID=1505588 RepID=UPI002E182BB9|nr:amino acid ABC transporter ATP-binding protein [Brenneria populi subsp. brevivirga]
MNDNNTVLRVKNLSKAFGENNILSNISFNVIKGQTVSVIGPSGAGKSTLARCVCGLEPFFSGKIYINDAEIAQLINTSKKRSYYVGMIFQQFNLWPHMTVLDNVAFGLCRCRNLQKNDAYDLAMTMLEKVHLRHRSSYKPNALSGGEQQRTAIARALALNPSLLVFDEPTSALDPELIDEVLDVMQNLSDEGVSMLVITHEMSFAKEVSHHVVFMDEGVIAEQGNPGDLFSNPASVRARSFLKRMLTN